MTAIALGGQLAGPGLARGILGGAVGAAVGVSALALAGQLGISPQPGHYLALGYVGLQLGWLAGLGAFRFWARWVLGKPADAADELAAHGRLGDRGRYLRFTTDHKVIGLQYLVTSFILLVVAGTLALIMRLELAQPGQLIDRDTYNTIMSTHGTIMITVALIAIVGGLGNYLVPIMIGARDMAFPKVNALSYWLLPPAILLLLSNPLLGGFDSGWTAYPPLSEQAPLGQQAFLLTFITLGVSSIASAVNFLVTVARLRTRGMSVMRLPIFVWALTVTAVLVLVATSVVAMAMTMVLFDRLLGADFFRASEGGDPILFQHLFWFYSHPAVYVMAVPAFGAILEVVPVFARKPLFAYRLAVLSFIAIGLLSFMVWAHHMFVSGMADIIHVPIMVTTELISVPTGIVFLSALGTIWLGRIRFATPMLWVFGFLWSFLIGGITGVYLADVPTDIVLSDTYFVVAHFHFTIVGGMIFGLFAGTYYWFPKMTGRMLDERLGRIHFWAFTLAFNATFLPMFVLGLIGMRRRVADYPAELASLNLLASVSAVVIALSVLLFVVNAVRSWLRGPLAGANPWGARTLEWQIPSPPPVENFDHAPVVTDGPYGYGGQAPVAATLPRTATGS
jgi:cytochrome c oxidase subunit 1